jgi:hypothetical protein
MALSQGLKAMNSFLLLRISMIKDRLVAFTTLKGAIQLELGLWGLLLDCWLPILKRFHKPLV